MDKHLVPLKPPAAPASCPFCGAQAVTEDRVVFPGIHIMAESRCTACGSHFMRDLPVGFAVDHPTVINMATGRVLDADPRTAWIHGPLQAAHAHPSSRKVPVERIVFRESERIILLNTLDFLYGHVLLKLYNAAHYLERYPDHGLVVMVPRMFRWLVPEGVAEAWVVDLRLGDMHGWYPSIDGFVQEQLARYSEVMLGRGYAHPEFAGLDIQRFTGVAAFPLEAFSQRPAHITFVAREDRLWFASPMGKFMHRAINRSGLGSMLGRWYVKAQDRLIRRTMRRIRRSLPGVRFTVVGLGTGGSLSDVATDLRTRQMNDSVERTWVEAYAASQIVIGVHGSNMLLPTAHAAGCIEILPNDRYGNIVQDISVRWHDRMQLFLYRFVDEFAKPAAVARHAVAMFTEFNNYHRNNCINGFSDRP